jgi:uncharacterized membrane protein YgcG
MRPSASCLSSLSGFYRLAPSLALRSLDAAVVRDLASLLKGTAHKDLPPDLADLRRSYPRVVVLVVAPLDDAASLLAKKWKDFQHHLLALQGVELLLCQSSEVGSL